MRVSAFCYQLTPQTSFVLDHEHALQVKCASPRDTKRERVVTARSIGPSAVATLDNSVRHRLDRTNMLHHVRPNQVACLAGVRSHDDTPID